MKESIRSSFEFMGRPENATNAILFTACFALFFIVIGVGLAWIVSLLISKKVEKPISFDDFIEQTNKQSSFKIRRVR